MDDSCGLKELAEIVREKSGWDKAKVRINRDKRRALGFSCVYYGVGLGAKGRYLDRAGAFVNIYRDGSVEVNVGNTEMGQGALTVLTQIAAETLNAPMTNIKLSEVDTSKVPDSGPTVASRTTLMSGNAIIDACLPLRENIFYCASRILKARRNQTKAYGGFFYFGKKKVSFEAVIKECWSQRLKMSQQGWYVAPKTTFDIKNGQGDAYVVYSYSANIADVEVDIKTGEKKVHKYMLHMMSDVL